MSFGDTIFLVSHQLQCVGQPDPPPQNARSTLAGVAQVVGASSRNRKVTGLIPGQGT